MARKVTLFCPFFLEFGFQVATALKIFPQIAIEKLFTDFSIPLIHHRASDSITSNESYSTSRIHPVSFILLLSIHRLADHCLKPTASSSVFVELECDSPEEDLYLSEIWAFRACIHPHLSTVSECKRLFIPCRGGAKIAE